MAPWEPHFPRPTRGTPGAPPVLTVVLHPLGEAPLQRLVHGLQPGGDVLVAARSLLRPHQLLERGKHLPARTSQLGVARELSSGGGAAPMAPCPTSRRPGACLAGGSGLSSGGAVPAPAAPGAAALRPSASPFWRRLCGTRGYGSPRGPQGPKGSDAHAQEAAGARRAATGRREGHGSATGRAELQVHASLSARPLRPLFSPSPLDSGATDLQRALHFPQSSHRDFPHLHPPEFIS